jgi:small subunit ribosomal protein S3
MDEKKFVKLKEEELEVREYIKNSLGKGRISEVSIEYTPVGEKIIVATNRPGMVIGSRGDKINELTYVLKKRFKLDNPHIEIRDIPQPLFDAQLVADDIAISLERKGSLKFKPIAYRTLEAVMKAGALGAELVLSGKLPSDRARSWRFAQGYLKKTGDPAKVVRCAMAQAKTMAGVIGIQVRILPPDAKIHDKITIDDALLTTLKARAHALNNPPVHVEKEKPAKKKASRKER